MEKNEILVFRTASVGDIPSLVRDRPNDDYLAELRSLSALRIPCHRVCATLLDHRFRLPWDNEDAPESLLFPMVRTFRQFHGKCALRGIPKDIGHQLWALHRFCLGTFLPPSEMDDADVHRMLCSFARYRGHLSGEALSGIDSRHSPGSYFSLLLEAAQGTEKQEDVAHVMSVFDTLLPDALQTSHKSSLYVVLGFR